MNFSEYEWPDLNPDSAIHSFGNSSEYTAFIWVYDKDKNRAWLFVQPGNEYHGYGFNNTELRHAKNLAKRNTVAMFGRFGEAKKQRATSDHPEGGFVTVWRYKDDEYPTDHYDKSINYEFSQATPSDVKVFLKSMLGKFPLKVIGHSPAKLPITPDYMFTSPQHGAVQIGEFLGQETQVDPCSGMKIDVHGRPTAIPDIMGQLHMVRGQQLDLLKGAFCSQYQGLKSSPQYKDCGFQQRQLDYIAGNLKCGGNDYKTALQAGKLAYKQKLRDIFSDPHKINKEFRTQKEIDAAWDYLNQKEHFSFREWYSKWNGSGS